MTNFFNKLHKTGNLLSKIFLFIATTFLIVYLFPKSGSFRYDFQRGKPWLSENLYSPLDFAIKKSKGQIESEIEKVKKEAEVYFEIDSTVFNRNRTQVMTDDYFTSLNFDSIFSGLESDTVRDKCILLIDDIYSIGVISKNYDLQADQIINVLQNNTLIKSATYSQFFNLNKLNEYLDEKLTRTNFEPYISSIKKYFAKLIVPNAIFNKKLTETALEDRINQISPVRGQVEKGTLIISKGDIIQGDKLAMLETLELEYKSQVWTESNYIWVISAYTALVALALLMLLLFLRKYRYEIFLDNNKITFIFFNILLMVFLTTLVIGSNSAYVYIVPLCILPLILKAFFDARLGLFAHVITVLLLGFIVPNNYEYMFLQIIAGIVTILTVSELYKRANLFISVGQITIIYIIAYFSFYLIQEGSIEGLKWENFLLFVICGLATLFVQPLIYLYEKLFGLVSDVSLLELTDTNTKLLKKLSDKAPGTYHHSINVANLAEACANEINANSMLVRVGALYHDIGKMSNPKFFTENQSNINNPHDQLSPKESAEIIIGHVLNGVEIAKKYKLPARVINFIRTHHGTSTIRYFFNKQKEIDSKFDIKDFKYKGPIPFNKETAILMMCDSVEAASKSLREPTSDKINSFVNSIISKQIDEGQFLDSEITFKEIESIKKILKHKLANMYHVRIEYPE
tara:strand:+ start:25173 stop:27230 length:2058 start_codon:yes stop_codon:yes gene_type:complete